MFDKPVVLFLIFEIMLKNRLITRKRLFGMINLDFEFKGSTTKFSDKQKNVLLIALKRNGERKRGILRVISPR